MTNRKLTKLQKVVIELLMQDLSSKEVAYKIGMEQTNVSTVLEGLRKRFRVNTTHGLLLKIQEEYFKESIFEEITPKK